MNENEILEESKIKNLSSNDFTTNFNNKEFTDIKLEETTSKD